MKTNTLVKADAKQIALIKATADSNIDVAMAAQRELATALTTPLRQGMLNGDILFSIYQPIDVQGEGVTADFPLDLLSPGTEKEHVAFTIPNHGYIPQRHVEGDYVHVPTFPIGNAIDWNIRYARNARWDILSRAMQVYRAGYTKKMNDDGWQTVLTAGYDRNIIVFDSDAAAGQFTKRLVSLMKTVMRRNGGGNSTSTNRGKLTDLFVSPEATEDMRNWNVDQIDEITRREIFVSENDNALNRIFGVNLHDLDELGEGQEYNDFFDNDLGATFPSGDVEIVVGLDLSKNDSFVMPVKEEVTIFPDPALHRHQRVGYYGWAEVGFGILDNRRVLIGSL